ncbi:hypothetical protein BAE44_0003008 [Dichanthelium oligosanthes]|uniref:Rapid alkalinization factor n=1 Tax=Dichanthelium oligosanthes TaxID=888268 RepID=A0A1E5WEZ1_9POAL|nr:hypothetical protein BAE44_0003008 [Dichanthelium oligosanthes]
MEKVSSTKLPVVLVCLLLLAAAPREAEAMEWLTYPRAMISCKVLGNCDKNASGVDPTRPGKSANPYTRGCNAIERCRG